MQIKIKIRKWGRVRSTRVGKEERNGWAQGRAEGKLDRVAGGRRAPQVKKTKEKKHM